ncbi:hypothetical protein BH09VER1_BH09VER1_44160 [soil metagenome]
MLQTAAQAAQAELASHLFHVEPTIPSPLDPTLLPHDWHWKRSPGDTPAETEKLREMKRAAHAFLTDIATGQPPRWLTLTGPPGCGKTHLASHIRSWLQKNGEQPYKTTTNQSTHSTTPRTYLDLYTYAQEGPLFTKWSRLLEAAREGNYAPLRRAAHDHYKIIDDLAVDSFDHSAQPTVFATQKIAELLDRRLGKWTVITTNFTLNHLATYFDPRIASRLLRGPNLVIDCHLLRDYSLRREAIFP